MSSSYPPSTCATHGSVKGSIQAPSDGSNANTISSDSKNEACDRTSSSATKHQDTSNSSAKQHEYSASRIADYLNDKVDSQTMHRHSSTEASIRDHVSHMGAYIDDIDATLARSEG